MTDNYFKSVGVRIIADNRWKVPGPVHRKSSTNWINTTDSK